jgi:hypothetical protein
MHPIKEYEFAQRWIQWGMNDCAISRLTGIPRSTIREWRVGSVRAPRSPCPTDCPICGWGDLKPKSYSYLLGMYLGDGCISSVPKGVFRLRITLDDRYPMIIQECRDAIQTIAGPKRVVGRIQCIGCTEVYAYWKHWPCLFPQHGHGPKHLREIVLTQWQQEIADAHPDALLRGLIHSDGCRVTNTVNRPLVTGETRSYSYPRYQFTNHSAGIRSIFCRACDVYGVAWKQSNWRTISISRRDAIARLDDVIGPKR